MTQIFDTPLLYNTTLTAGAYMNPGGTPNNSLQGACIQLAAGILGSFFRPLLTHTYNFPQLPMAFNFQGGSFQAPVDGGESFFVPQPDARWQGSLQGQSGNEAAVDLGDGYSLHFDERNSEISITNAETGETTKIWGDPHVDVDGKRAFDFWGTTTFTLENGTKITINTEEWNQNPDAYVASQVVITKGDQAIVVDGISQNTLGDLKLSMSNDGQMIDAMTRDGFVLHENATGSGWRSELTGEVATQADLDITRKGELYGPGSTMPSVGEISSALSTFLFFGFVSAMADVANERIARYEDRFQF